MWIILLLIIHCVLTTTINHDNLLDYKCEINADCVTLMDNSICFDRKCVCPLGYKINEKFQCVLEKNELRDRRQINYGKNNSLYFFILILRRF
jgi:hypothetical protein